MILKGQLSDLKDNNGSINLSFSGKVSFNIIKAPQDEPPWEGIQLDIKVKNIPIQTSDWYASCPEGNTPPDGNENTLKALKNCIQKEEWFSIQAFNPNMSFSSSGALNSIEAGKLSIWGGSIFDRARKAQTNQEDADE